MSVKFGLIGKALSHSFSKEFFEEKFRELNLQGFSYELWEMDNIENIRSFIQEKENIRGFNVTIPFKEDIIKYLDVTSEEVKAIGACNCVLIKNGTFIGYNTDWWGFLNMIEPRLEEHHTSAIILGTGGAAKAVAFALKKLNISYTFVSRNSKQIPNSPCITYQDIKASHFQHHPIIINTTPLGMYPKINTLPPIPTQFIHEKNLVIDLIYNPKKTLLLQKAEEQQAKILNGTEMLYLQAEKSWYIWQNHNV